LDVITRLRVLALFLLCLGIAAVLAAQPAADPNLVVLGPNNLFANPNFDTGLGFWTPLVQDPSQVGFSATGETNGSGSAFVLANGGVGGANAIYQCVNLPKDYQSLQLHLSAFMLTQGQAVVGFRGHGSQDPRITTDEDNGHPTITLVPFAATDCSGTQLHDTLNYPAEYTGNAWVGLTAFPTLPPLTQSVQVLLTSPTVTPEAESVVFFDSLFLGPIRQAGVCGADSSLLCVNDQRFQIKATFSATCSTPAGGGIANGVQSNAAGGYLWCFDPGNPELFVKVLNACTPATGNTYWVFIAGLTNVGVTVTVTDTQTGHHKTYTNPPNTNFAPIFDTVGLAVCP
jgi:hypothetical protein